MKHIYAVYICPHIVILNLVYIFFSYLYLCSIALLIMAAITDLNRKRGTVKGRITKAFNSFQTPTAGVSILTPGAFKTFVKDRL